MGKVGSSVGTTVGIRVRCVGTDVGGTVVLKY